MNFLHSSMDWRSVFSHTKNRKIWIFNSYFFTLHSSYPKIIQNLWIFLNKNNIRLRSFSGREILAEELVIRGANIDQKNIDGWTALSAAAWHGKLLFLRSRWKLRKIYIRFICVCEHIRLGHDKVIDVLLKYGASIDVTDKDIKLPVFIAAERGK